MQTMAIIDSVKASSDIYCVMSGEIVEVNEELLEHPELDKSITTRIRLDCEIKTIEYG